MSKFMIQNDWIKSMSKFMTQNDLNKFIHKMNNLIIKIDQIAYAARKISQEISDRSLLLFGDQEVVQEETVRERDRLLLVNNAMPVVSNLCDSICHIFELTTYQLQRRREELDRISKKKS